MTPEEREEFNKSLTDSWNQGIFVEPNGIPNHIKEPVLYLRYEVGGVSGGSCWDSSNPQPYQLSASELEDNWEALDNYLMQKSPNITYLQYKKIMSKVHSSEKTEWEYYGNHTDYVIKYIKLSDLDKIIAELK